MACRYFLDDKELTGDALISYMNNLPHEEKLKIAPEIAKDSYSRLSWTPGEAQAARYDLSKQVSEIWYDPKTEKLKAFKDDGSPNGSKVLDETVKPEKIQDYIGKEAAKNLLATEKTKLGSHHLEGDNLKIGGEGMHEFYDKMLPRALEKIGKEYGVKVEEGKLQHENYSVVIGYKGKKWEVVDSNNRVIEQFGTKEEANEYVHSRSKPIKYIDIPEGLKNQALQKGFPLFTGGAIISPVVGNPFERKHKITKVDHNPFAK